jgi:Zn-dependent protease with chaperone function
LMVLHFVLVVTGLGSLENLPDSWQLPLSAAAMGVAVFAFGWVSRRFEWQADAFAARHLSEHPPVREEADSGGLETRPPREMPSKYIAPQAVDAMVGALESVAELNHLPRERFGFRHGSIAERVRRLRALQGVGVDALPIDGQVRWMKRGIGVMVAVMLMAAVASVSRERHERRPVTDGPPRSILPDR